MKNDTFYLSYTEWMQKLRIKISSNSVDADRQFFWILDGAAHPDMPGCLWKLADQPNAWPLYMNTYTDEARNHGPWFLPCVPDSPLSQWAFEQLETIPLGVLVESKTDMQNVLFEHYQQLLECAYPNPQGAEPKNGVYRFYDPRILYGISTWTDKQHEQMVYGPALSIHAWEPGRLVPIALERKTEEYLVCTDKVELSQDLMDHLWTESQSHTVIATLGGEAGEKLRAMPLPEAHAHVQSMRNLLAPSAYLSNKDIAFATALSLLTEDDSWEDVIEEVVFTRFPDCDSLEEALTQAIPVWETEQQRPATWAV